MECQHGQLARSCEICERDAELAEVKAERDRLRVECEAWRSWNLEHGHDRAYTIHLDDGPLDFDTIDDAVDALMAEQEVKP
jgi:hypothetical protein